MARRTVGTHKGVEEKRRSLPIYQHYTLSPGKTKSHHPEARCNHCEKEFVCGSKQRLIRHLRKCNSISNPEQIIAETLNTLARNSATGQLNHSILEASNLLPSQIPNHHHNNPVAPQHQLVAGQQQQQQIHSSSSTVTTANSNINNNNNNNNNHLSNHNTSGSSSNDAGVIAGFSNGSQQPSTVNPLKRSQRRGRKPANQLANNAPSIHVTTGLDGKTHFTPASQLPQTISGSVNTPLIAQVHNGRQVGYTYHHPTASPTSTSGAHLYPNSGHLACATHNHTAPYKLNSESIDKAYLKLVLTRNLPFSLCDTKEFQAWVKTFANDYKPPSSINLIAQNLKHEAQVAKQRISNILVKASKKTINLELHSWPDEIRGHLWYAIVANIEHKRFLISLRDINVQQNSTTHQSGEAASDRALAEFIDECIKRVGSDRINSLIFPGKYEADAFSTRARQSLYSTQPSIVTYDCWGHFTNLLCSDIVEYNKIFSDILRNSNRLIDFVNKRPKVGLGLEKFNPFSGVMGPINHLNNRRWYSHLVCYLLEYIKNNNEAITKALEAYTTSAARSHLSSDNNNNSASGTGNNRPTSTQTILCQEENDFIEIKSMIISSEYWTNLDLALVYLKPIRGIVALTSTVSSSSSNNNNNTNNNTNSNNTSNNPTETSINHSTPSILPATANALLLSDYMLWFLNYGKTLFDTWRQSPDSLKFQLIGRYLFRFSSSISEFKLLFAAYLLNPKHRCAYMTQKAKDTAIEEILNIASEFMPEESDGHTIFDQWKLYLVREEPYDMAYEENRSTPLEWWMSVPCAESIRRVALRILRLKAFASAKPETIFSQLYFYEDETKNNLNNTTFEDISVLRYFYDYEDKAGLHNQHGTVHNYSNIITNPSSNSFSSNGYHDRAQIGSVINHHSQQTNYSSEYLPADNLDGAPTTNGQANESLNESGQCFTSDSFSGAVVDSYTNQNLHLNMETKLNVGSALAIEDLPGYTLFLQYVNYNESGVQVVVEEPVEKKRRKWTAQEILSKCQANHQNSGNSNDLNCK